MAERRDHLQRPPRGIFPDRGWWIGAILMFCLGAGTVLLWWAGQTFPQYLPQLPGLLP